ncbi:tyrosine-sulfated glycopeptide receptor 1 [Olea europaea subsp. europaea]|uniref:Tyrosine-sulfated glycopeptide receptor 1 n=1 Tax=Olea europaea subsp. europaea TaxID=158383 RepID=A0A8S0S9N2_OLEEU|nr:tyrosine-sulfated glycopeptide receptor 1 [Olea europaea subsp. europaea]
MALQSLSFLSLTNNSLNNITSAVRLLTGCKTLRTLILSKNIYNEPLPGDENLIRAGEFQNLQVLGLGGCRFTGLRPTIVWGSSKPFLLGFVPKPSIRKLLHGTYKTEKTSNTTDFRSSRPSYLELPVFVQPNNASNLKYKPALNLPPAIYIRIYIEIGQLKVVVALDLRDNNFSGSIPDTISNLTNLEKLDLSSNNLSGQIHASLKNLHFLSFLMLQTTILKVLYQ